MKVSYHYGILNRTALISNKDIYGALYNWWTVVDEHNLCPAGFHVPNDAEWKTLD